MYMGGGEKDTDSSKDKAPHTFGMSILRRGIGSTKATAYCKLIAKIMQIITKELTTVIGVPSYDFRGIIR
jgi:hypothetical protein